MKPVCFVLTTAYITSHHRHRHHHKRHQQEQVTSVYIDYSDDNKTYFRVHEGQVETSGRVIIRWGDQGEHRYWRWGISSNSNNKLNDNINSQNTYNNNNTVQGSSIEDVEPSAYIHLTAFAWYTHK